MHAYNTIYYTHLCLCVCVCVRRVVLSASYTNQINNKIKKIIQVKSTSTVFNFIVDNNNCGGCMYTYLRTLFKRFIIIIMEIKNKRNNNYRVNLAKKTYDDFYSYA